MTHRSLFPIPDNTRRTWCILVLKTTSEDGDQRIVGWGLGDANKKRVVETKTDESENNAVEEVVLRGLCRELEQRQYSEQTLITSTTDTVPLLRTRLLQSSFNQPSLRGFRHVNLEQIVNRYFGDDTIWAQISPSQPQHLEETINEIWRLRKRVGLLVPVSTLRGRSL